MDNLFQVLPLIIPLIILQVVFQIFALVDLIRRPREEIRGENKIIWGIVILIFAMLGPIIYFIFGRKIT
ncbi:MAG: PLD nuclease N-terminal domain-containing protein [Dictyoglomus sp.]|nr:PLD nuclease N-terminal domain-containing protein [Dictyoglomus sp.]MDW8188015.1 PLD nuclease N-terminal domain-containing protein [Dictyoglomus sp.]